MEEKRGSSIHRWRLNYLPPLAGWPRLHRQQSGRLLGIAREHRPRLSQVPGLCIKPPPGALLPPSPRRRGRGGKVLSQQGHLGSQRVVNKPCYYYAASPRARRRRRWQQQHEGRAAAAAFVSFVFSLLENGI